MKIALLASPVLRRGPLSPFVRFARDFEPFLGKHDLFCTEGCFRALLRAGVLDTYVGLHCLPAGYRGGIVEIAEKVVMRKIEVVIYLLDPRDPSSNYPETNALKRECVVGQVPFLATSRSAREWATLNWSLARPSVYFLEPKDVPSSLCLSTSPLFKPIQKQTIALVAHDHYKIEMLKFALKFFDTLIRFKHRIATGTTGALLNGKKPKRLSAKKMKKFDSLRKKLALTNAIKGKKKSEFVEELQSGPHGGDVQIANKILGGQCDIIIFFEDPFVPREHEQDIQLLERTGRVRGKDLICLHDPKTASWFMDAWRGGALKSGKSEAVLITTALERVFGVRSVLVESDLSKGVWDEEIAPAAARVLRGQMYWLSREKAVQGSCARVTVSWGRGMSIVANDLKKMEDELVTLSRNQMNKPELEEDIATPRFLQPGNVVVGPMQGVIGAEDEHAEANQIASVVATQLGGSSLQLSLAALLGAKKNDSERERLLSELNEHWKRTDLLVTTCAPLEREPGKLVQAPLLSRYYKEIEKRGACGEFGGIYLKPDGTHVKTSKFERIGMNFDEVVAVAKRQGSMLVVGEQPDRLIITLAALKANLVSILVTDLDFARKLLKMAGS